MKRILAIMMAALMVFAIVGCADNSGGEPTPSTTAGAGASTAPGTGAPETSAPATTEPGTSGGSGEENGAGEVSGTLNIYTWEGYFPQEILDEFTARTGVEIQFSPFATNEEMLMRLQTDNAGTYDIVLASDYIIDIARGENLLAELDKSAIPNYENLGEEYLSKFYDPDNKYTMPYAPGSPLIIYDPDKVDIEIKGYEDLWNEALKDSVVLIDQPRVIIGITLKTLGYSFNETDEAKLDEAKEKLFKLRPNIRSFNHDTPHEDLLGGEASVGFMFTSQLNTALLENDKYEIVYPEEGLGFGIDSIFVPANAPNKDAAMAFINFLCEPEIGAKIAENTYYMNANKAAEEFYTIPDPALEKVLNIPSDMIDNAEFIENIGTEADAKYTEIWTEFKQQ